VPPSGLRTIGDARLNEEGRFPGAYYGRRLQCSSAGSPTARPDPVDQLIAFNYCDICNPFSYAKIDHGAKSAGSARGTFKDAIDFFNDLDHG